MCYCCNLCNSCGRADEMVERFGKRFCNVCDQLIEDNTLKVCPACGEILPPPFPGVSSPRLPQEAGNE